MSSKEGSFGSKKTHFQPYIVGTQKPSQKELPGIIDMLLNRYVGKVANAQESAQLTGHAGLQAHKLTGKGDFIHISNGGEGTRFQVAMATAQDFNQLERAEVAPVIIEQGGVLDLPAMPQAKAVGRPRLEVEAEALAWYFYHNPQRISRAMANEAMGLSRDNHNLHKQFCLRFVEAFKRLRQGGTL